MTVGLSGLLNQGATQPALYTLVITGALLSIVPLVALFLTAPAVLAGRPHRGRGQGVSPARRVRLGSGGMQDQQEPRAADDPRRRRGGRGLPRDRLAGAQRWPAGQPGSTHSRERGDRAHRLLRQPARPRALGRPLAHGGVPADRASAPALRGPELLDPAARRGEDPERAARSADAGARPRQHRRRTGPHSRLPRPSRWTACSRSPSHSGDPLVGAAPRGRTCRPWPPAASSGSARRPRSVAADDVGGARGQCSTSASAAGAGSPPSPARSTPRVARTACSGYRDALGGRLRRGTRRPGRLQPRQWRWRGCSACWSIHRTSTRSSWLPT